MASETSKVLSHLKIETKRYADRALVCGAPERAKWIADHLEGGRLLAQNREYHSYLGKFEGEDILVVSHGVGASGAAICFQEVFQTGVKAMVRLGTAGALQDGMGIGDLVVATGAVRRDGVTDQMIPPEYPAIPSLSLTQSLMSAFDKAKTDYKSGIVLTSALFYPSVLEGDLALYAKAGTVAVEMECSTLFVMGTLQRVHTGSVLALDGNPLKWDQGVYDPNSNRMKQNMELAIRRCLEGLARFKL